MSSTPITSTPAAARALGAYLRPHRRLVTLLVAGLALDLAVGATLPLLFRTVVDDAVPAQDRDLLVTLLVVMTVLGVASAAAAVARDRIYAELGARVLRDLRMRMFAHLQRLPTDFFGRTTPADVSSRFAGDLAAVHEAVVYAMPEVLIGLAAVGVYGTVLWTVDPDLALLTLLGLPLLLIGPRFFGRRAEAASAAVREDEALVVGAVAENVTVHRVVAAYDLAQQQTEAFAARTERLYRTSVRFNIASYLAERAPNVTFALLQIGIGAAGAMKAYSGDLAVGALIAFNALLLALGTALAGLTRTLPLLLSACGGVGRITALLDEPAAAQSDCPTDDVPPPAGLHFEGVSFSYGQGRQLDSIDLRIEAGTHVAFVGGSGAGKSTVLNLLQRAYDPTDGRITLGGRDIRELPVATYRAGQGVVFQDALLFDLSIAENIRLGRPAATDAEVRAAGAAAGVEAFVVELPDGWTTRVGDGGRRLSGGQRQRVALARALVRRPALLLLDEATSALDATTEREIDATIAGLTSRHTVVSVTHRLSSVIGCDAIHVLAGGRLVESGTHHELLARNGHYRRLWESSTHESINQEGNSDDRDATHDPAQDRPRGGAQLGPRRVRRVRHPRDRRRRGCDRTVPRLPRRP